MRADGTPGEDRWPVFTWVHLSDLHFGHGDPAWQWDQRLVLAELRRDLVSAARRPDTPIDAILVTGDVAFSGGKRAETEYEQASEWLRGVADTLGVPHDRVFVVPGNHDVRRGEGGADADALVEAIRHGSTKLDGALAAPGTQSTLLLRLHAFWSFAEGFAPVERQGAGWWTTRIEARNGRTVRLVGWNTALVCMDDTDHGKLQLGTGQLAAFETDPVAGEVVVALTHHPFTGGWLRDEKEVAGWVHRAVDVHLSGHTHEPGTAGSVTGAGSSHVRVVAGAGHVDGSEQEKLSHGYNFAQVLEDGDGSLVLRVWPRRWRKGEPGFVVENNSTPDGEAWVEHRIGEPRAARPARGSSLPLRTATGLAAAAAGVLVLANVGHPPALFDRLFAPEPVVVVAEPSGDAASRAEMLAFTTAAFEAERRGEWQEALALWRAALWLGAERGAAGFEVDTSGAQRAARDVLRRTSPAREIDGRQAATLDGRLGAWSDPTHPTDVLLARAGSATTLRLSHAGTYDLSATPLLFSPDGSRLVSGVGGRLDVRVWDTATGAAVAHFGEAEGVYEFSATGHWLFAWSGGSSEIWQTRTFERMTPPEGGSLVATTDDERLGLFQRGEHVILRDLMTHEVRAEVSLPHPPDVVAMTGDGGWAVTVTDAGQPQGVARRFRREPVGDVAVFQSIDLERGRVVDTRSEPGLTAAVPRAGLVFTGRWSGIWEVRDGATWALVRSVETGLGPITALAVSPDGTRLATVHKALAGDWWDGAAAIWDVATGRRLQTLANVNPEWVPRFEGVDVAFEVWNVLSTPRLKALLRVDDPVPSEVASKGDTWGDEVTYDPLGGLVLGGVGADDGHVRWVDPGTLATGCERSDVVSLLRPPRFALVGSSDGDGAHREGPRGLFDLARCRVLVDLPTDRAYDNSAAISGDHSLFAIRTDEGPAEVWDLRTGRLVATLSHVDERGDLFGDPSQDGIEPIAFSPDGRYLATRIWLGQAVSGCDYAVFEIGTGRQRTGLPRHCEPTFVDAAGRWQVLGLDGDDLVRSDALDGHEIARWPLPASGATTHLSRSPDGRWLAGASNDGTAWLVDAVSGATTSTHGLGVVLDEPDVADDGVAVFEGAEHTVLLSPAGLLCSLDAYDATPPENPHDAALSPTGDEVAFSYPDGRVEIWPTELFDAVGLARWLGARSNLRVCRATQEVVRVVPFPEADTVWAEPAACAKLPPG